MTDWDRQYIELCKEILNKGVEVENRTGVNTIKIPSYELRFDLSKEFPILTTKQLFFKDAIIEMLWIWQMQSNKITDLQERGVHIWDEWMVDKDGIYRIYEPYGDYDPDKEVVVIDPFSVPVSDPFGKRHPFKEKRDKNGTILTAKSLIPGKTIKAAKWYGKKYAGTNGTAYGYINKRYELTQNLIYTLKNDPTDRRNVRNLWQDEYLRGAVLPSCVYGTEWDVTNGKLNLLVHQRSCDVPLGLPFNVTQYATFLAMIAQVTNLEPSTIRYSIKDAHIYVNQVDGIKEQLRREQRYNELSNMNKLDLYHLKKYVQEKIDKVDDKKSKEYKLLDSEIKTIDMILSPSKPIMILNPEIDDFFEFDNSKELKDVLVLNYKHMGRIDFPIAQ